MLLFTRERALVFDCVTCFYCFSSWLNTVFSRALAAATQRAQGLQKYKHEQI